jgi:antitoxin CptB
MSIELNRIRWRSRRGLLELDILLERFVTRHLEQLDDSQLAAYVGLLACDDNHLFDLLNNKAVCDDPAQRAIVDLIRAV